MSYVPRGYLASNRYYQTVSVTNKEGACTPRYKPKIPDRDYQECLYVQKQLGDALTKCLAEVCEIRPCDPIEYIAQWLYNHHRNKIQLKKTAEENETLERQREEQEREAELLLLGRPDAPEPNSLYRISTLGTVREDSLLTLQDTVHQQNPRRRSSEPSQPSAKGTTVTTCKSEPRVSYTPESTA